MTKITHMTLSADDIQDLASGRMIRFRLDDPARMVYVKADKIAVEYFQSFSDRALLEEYPFEGDPH